MNIRLTTLCKHLTKELVKANARKQLISEREWKALEKLWYAIRATLERSGLES